MSWIQSDLQEPEPYTPPSWSTGTDAEIVEVLEKHYNGEIDLTEYWSVGDTRRVTLSAMSATGVGESHAEQTVSFVLSNVGGKYLSDGVTECLFQVDQLNSLNETGYINSTNTNTGGWKSSKRRAWCNNVYKNAIPSTLRGIFKEFINQSGTGGGTSVNVENTTDTFALRAEIEIFGSRQNSAAGEGSQIKWYETTSNRTKKVNSYNSSWWERSQSTGWTNRFCCVDSSGNTDYTIASDNRGLAPFGVI